MLFNLKIFRNKLDSSKEEKRHRWTSENVKHNEVLNMYMCPRWQGFTTLNTFQKVVLDVKHYV